MKLNQDALGKPCDRCRQLITQETIDAFEKSKAVRVARIKSMTGPGVGRPVSINWALVKELRQKYWTQIRIAKHLKISRQSVCRGLKRMGVK